MKFVDEALIQVKAGAGGPGASHFRREKFVPFGGPDGGDGGQGGSVVLVADSRKQTLLDFRFNPLWQAENGKPGAGSLRQGKSGKDLKIHLPVGTQVFRNDDNSLVIDLTEPGAQFTIAKGGRGGKGNAFFKSATNQAPQRSQPGEVGAQGTFLLSLKLVADVGLVGLPNAGKSTLISRISAAKPKIADYPFTTLVPNLGVVKGRSLHSFVVADIPGLIPGAHIGKGLGHKFLKHVERTRVLAHLIDVQQVDSELMPSDPFESFNAINKELELFSENFTKKPQLVVLTKIDTSSDPKQLETVKQGFQKNGHECIAISSASGQGIPELLKRLEQMLLQANQESSGIRTDF